MTAIDQINCYFANLNPVAEKIAFDIREVKSAYDHVWLTLSSIEQDDILNDTIIRPEITIKYFKNSQSPSSLKADPRMILDSKKKLTKCQKSNIYTYDKQNLRTFINQKVGLKIIHDENIGDYRDEHSFPFSYKTKSQINLSVIVSNTNISVKDNDLFKPFIQEDSKQSTPVQNKALVEWGNHDQFGEKPNSLCTTVKLAYLADEKKFHSSYNFGSKKTLLDNFNESTDSENETKDENGEICKLLPEKVQIPKGFDFLSNW